MRDDGQTFHDKRTPIPTVVGSVWLHLNTICMTDRRAPRRLQSLALWIREKYGITVEVTSAQPCKPRRQTTDQTNVVAVTNCSAAFSLRSPLPTPVSCNWTGQRLDTCSNTHRRRFWITWPRLRCVKNLPAVHTWSRLQTYLEKLILVEYNTVNQE